MRYIDIADASFTDANGNTNAVKEIRFINTMPAIQFTLDVDSEWSLDELASRPDVYGRGAEGDAFKIFDGNAVAIVDAQFDYSKVRRVKIPV